MVSCQKGPTRHAYAWQIGPFWQDTLDITNGWNFRFDDEEEEDKFYLWCVQCKSELYLDVLQQRPIGFVSGPVQK